MRILAWVLQAVIAFYYLMVIGGGEFLLRLMRHESLPAKVRGVSFAMTLVLVLIRWRIASKSGSASQFASRA